MGMSQMNMYSCSSYLKMAFSHMWFVGFYVTTEGKTTSAGVQKFLEKFRATADLAMMEIGPYQGALIACGKIAWGKGLFLLTN